MIPGSVKSRTNSLECLISEFTRPLRNIGVPFFSYARIYKDNTFLFLCNQPDWQQIKYDNNLFDFKGFVPTLNLRPNIFTKILFTGQPDEKIPVFPALYKAGYWNLIGYYSYTNDFIESVHFGGNREQSGIINLYLNHSEYFEKFIYGFRYLFTDLLEPPDTALLFPLNDFYIEPNPKTMRLSFIPLLKNTLPMTIHGKNFLLSSRQVECLAHLLRGATAKETAQILKLSFRTVQFYHRNLLTKFDSDNLSDILFSLSYQEVSYILSHIEDCKNNNIDQQEEIEKGKAFLRKHAPI